LHHIQIFRVSPVYSAIFISAKITELILNISLTVNNEKKNSIHNLVIKRNMLKLKP